MTTKHLASTFLFYGFSTAVNKGILLITIPLLSGVLTLEDYGLWSLSQVVIVIGAPLMSLNGYSSILRFGVNDKQIGNALLKKYLRHTLFIAALSLLFFKFYGINWISLTLLLAQVEAFQLLLLGWCRSRDYHIVYLMLSMIKIISIILSILVLNINSLDNLLLWQLIFSSIILFSLYIYLIIKDRHLVNIKLNMNKFLSFSLYLIPHNIALWILSSSDRIIIKNILNELELGLYSLAYSLALILMIFNSGIALTLPNYIISKYETYINSNLKIKMILGYSLLTIITNIILHLFIYLFEDKIDYLNKVDENIYIIIAWVFNGIYLLGLYYFYSNILFYYQKAKLISLNTLGVSILNVILTIVMVNYFGIKGAAIATFLAYMVYLISNVYFSYRIENAIKKDVPYLLGVAIITILFNFFSINLLY